MHCELKKVSKTYRNGTHALYDLNLSVKEGEFVYIIGPTGSGKSTLIKLLNGEEIPTSGTVHVCNTNIGKLKHSRVPKYRRKIGVVFQEYRLLEKKTVFENIAYALEVLDEEPKEIRKRVKEVLKLVDLEDKRNSFPYQLSGGQQQRVAIARAIINNPKILIADEPTGNLDPEKSDEIMQLLEKINKEKGTTILMVTHDSNLVNRYKKRTIVLEGGVLIADLSEGGYIARH